ncbi:hypothetical protein Gotur_004028 [Gossypium turneri]
MARHRIGRVQRLLRPRVDEALALGAVITSDLSDEALSVKLVCWLDPCIRSKACACPQGVVFAEEMGFDKVIVEVDSMIVIKKLQSPENDRSLIVVIINEIKEKTRRLRSIKFRYIFLRANEAAHAVASWGERMLSPEKKEDLLKDLQGTQRLKELGEENDPHTLFEEYQFPRKRTFDVAITKKKGKGNLRI